MKKNLKSELFRRIRIELAVILVAAIVLSMACFANFGASAETKDLALNLKGGPDYTFTGENATVPQFTVETAEALTVSTDITRVKFDLKMPDVVILRQNMSKGSKGGNAVKEDMTYGSDSFAIYFSGTDVTMVGITQKDFYAALDKYADHLAAGQSVTMFFNISGSFKDTGVITGLNIMVSRSKKAEVFDGKPFSLSNIVFNPSDSEEDHIPTPPPPSGDSTAAFNELELKDGPDFKFTAQGWDPQLSVEAVNKCYVQTDFTKIKFDLKMPDVETLRPLMNTGSRGGGVDFDEFGVNNSGYHGGAFAIYFSGSDVKRVGVTQSNFFAALDANKDALAAGEAVTLEFTISGNFKAGASISGIHIMLAHYVVGKDLSPFNDSPISISNMHFPVDYTPATLEGGSEFKFEGNETEPQLKLKLKNEIGVATNINRLNLDIKLDYAAIKESMSAGSKFQVGGEGPSYDAATALAIYFEGTNILGAGVTYADLVAALEENAEKLNAGEKVSLSLPISGAFAEDAKISGINMMIAHDAAAQNLADVPVTISNVKFKYVSDEEAAGPEEGEIVLKGGPDFKFSGSKWYPQLGIETEDYALPTDTVYMQLQIKMTQKDIDTFLTYMKFGSRGGGVDFDAFGVDDSGYHGGAFGIYFEGENTSYIGITQNDLKAILSKFKPLFNGTDTVFIELPVSAPKTGIPEGVIIKKINFMTSNDALATNYEGLPITIVKASFSKESRQPVSEGPVFGAEHIKSLDETKTKVDYDRSRIYVIAGSTVETLLDTVWIDTDKFFSSYVNYEGSRMSNKSKAINDYEFRYVITHPQDFTTEFEVIPCHKKNGVLDATSPIPKPDKSTVGEDPVGDDESTLEDEIEDEEEPEEEVTDEEYEEEYEDEYYEDEYYDDEYEDEDEESVIIPSTSGGKNKVVKQTVTENIAMYTIPQLIILIAACVLIGAAIMFIVDLFIIKGKKKN